MHKTRHLLIWKNLKSQICSNYMNFNIKLLNNLFQIKTNKTILKTWLCMLMVKQELEKPIPLKFFNKTWMESTLKVCAYIHSKCCNVKKGLNDSFINISSNHKIKSSCINWKNIKHLIVDEVSMVGCDTLVDLKLQTLKTNIFPFEIPTN